MEELTPFKHEKYGGGNADNYLDFIVSTLKPYVDKNYRTKTNANNTALFGSSLGGLVSFYGHYARAGRRAAGYLSGCAQGLPGKGNHRIL